MIRTVRCTICGKVFAVNITEEMMKKVIIIVCEACSPGIGADGSDNVGGCTRIKRDTYSKGTYYIGNN